MVPPRVRITKFISLMPPSIRRTMPHPAPIAAVNAPHSADRRSLRAVMSKSLAHYSIEHDCGLKIARTALSDLPEKPETLSQAMTYAAAYAALTLVPRR